MIDAQDANIISSSCYSVYVYRYATTCKTEYSVSLRHWSMDHEIGPPLKPDGPPTLKIVQGPLRTDDPPTYKRSDFHIKEHSLHEWYVIHNKSIIVSSIHSLMYFYTYRCIYIDRDNLWDAVPLSAAKPRSKYEFVGFHKTQSVLRYRELPCRCSHCRSRITSPSINTIGCQCTGVSLHLLEIISINIVSYTIV